MSVVSILDRHLNWVNGKSGKLKPKVWLFLFQTKPTLSIPSPIHLEYAGERWIKSNISLASGTNFHLVLGLINNERGFLIGR